MTETQTQPRVARRTAAKQMIIDCDIHNVMAPGVLEPYLSDRWLSHLKTFGSRQHAGNVYPKGSPARYDAFPPSGLPAGADLGFMQKQHLDGLNVEFGILGALSSSGSQLDPEFSAALSAATNDWQIKEWLDNKEMLPSRRRAINPADIMILVRRRSAGADSGRSTKPRSGPASSSASKPAV